MKLSSPTCSVHLRYALHFSSAARERASTSARSPSPAFSARLSGFLNLAQTVRAPSFTCRLSGTVILYNKYILAYYGFPFPIALTMWHMTFSGVLAFLLVRLGYVGVRVRACCASLATSYSAWGLAASMLTSQQRFASTVLVCGA